VHVILVGFSKSGVTSVISECESNKTQLENSLWIT